MRIFAFRLVSALVPALLLCGAVGTTQQTTVPPQSAGAEQAQPPASEPAATPPSASSGAPSGQEAPEIAAEDTSTTFKVRVNLVEVRAVVRDGQGHAVGNLKQEDFQLFDNGKPQVISRFSTEQSGLKPPMGSKPEGPPESGATLVMPKRYIAYLFDDVHLQASDLAQIRSAAARSLQSLQTTDRAGIFTTSGQVELDFTDDRAKLMETLNRVRPTSMESRTIKECPNITYYMADLIENKHDNQALEVAIQDALDCGAVPPPTSDTPTAIQAAMQTAAQVVKNEARRKLDSENHETLISLNSVKSLVRKIAAMPGQRNIVIISPGFYNPEDLREQGDVADRAVHSYVTISGLDARGLYSSMPDASNRSENPTMLPQILRYQRDAAMADAEILSELSADTGGSFFHNNNDFDKAFQQLLSPPEYSYLLGFSPQGLKFDGRFHNVKVTVKGPQKLVVQARKGYYAPKQALGEAAQAKQQVEDEVFSQEELHELPVEMQTQFFKTSDDEAKLSVVVRLDVRHLRYRKADGRNNGNLTVVSAIFDRNGNFVNGIQKTVQMHWKDETLSTKLGSGITLKNNFDVKPGSYIVRLVVRDEDGQLAAQNGSIEIP